MFPQKRNLLPSLFVCSMLFAVPELNAQCVNGVCQTRTPVRTFVQRQPVRQIIQSQPVRTFIQSQPIQQAFPSQIVTNLIPPSVGLSIGQRDYDGAIITSVGVPVEATVVTTTATVVETLPVPSPVVATPLPSPVVKKTAVVETKAKTAFKSELTKAIQTARKEGKISPVEAVKARVALLSPAFVERAHDLAVTQIAFSGEVNENVPVSPEGVVQVEGINWEGLTKFLEAIVPLIISLLKMFGTGD